MSNVRIGLVIAELCEGFFSSTESRRKEEQEPGVVKEEEGFGVSVEEKDAEKVLFSVS